MSQFPIWNPNSHTRSKFGSSDRRAAYKALRNSSSGFIARKDVREYIFKRDGHKCYLCGSTEDLQIDHIVSVYQYWKEELPVNELNSEENLVTICKKCNSAKRP